MRATVDRSRRRNFILWNVFALALVLLTAGAQGQDWNVTLTNAAQAGAAGGTLTFDGTITNNTGQLLLFSSMGLRLEGASSDNFYDMDFTQDFLNHNLSFPNTTYTGPIFTLNWSAEAWSGLAGTGTLRVTVNASNGATTQRIPFYASVSSGPTGPRSQIGGRLTLDSINPYAPALNTMVQLRPTDGSATATRFLTVGPDGNFTLPDVAQKQYVLNIKADTYLAKSIFLDATQGDVLNITALLLAGDSNNDNSVDSTDFGVLIGAYGSDASIAGSGYDPGADFNGDGFVDSTDFGLLIENFGATGDP